MARLKEIYDCIDRIAPFSSAMEFDNVGILVGDDSVDVNRALISLDITPAVIEEAKSKNCNLIISHHPVIFEPLRELNCSAIPYLLARENILALCCHTNLDLTPHGGVNIALGEKLGLRDIKGEQEYGEGYLIYSGVLKNELEPEDFAKYVKEKLGSSVVRYSAGSRKVQKVSFVAGAAGEWAKDAVKYGDAYICGEMKHHEELEAAELDITVVSAGHYETEKPYAARLQAYLQENIKDTGFILSENENNPMKTI